MQASDHPEYRQSKFTFTTKHCRKSPPAGQTDCPALRRDTFLADAVSWWRGSENYTSDGKPLFTVDCPHPHCLSNLEVKPIPPSPDVTLEKH